MADRILVFHVHDMPHDPDPHWTYIGRAAFRAANSLAHVESPFANPFKVVKYRHDAPGEAYRWAARQFERWLDDDPAFQDFDHRRAELLERLPELIGQNLACWCARPGEPLLTWTRPYVCHGQVLARRVEALRG